MVGEFAFHSYIIKTNCIRDVRVSGHLALNAIVVPHFDEAHVLRLGSRALTALVHLAAF